MQKTSYELNGHRQEPFDVLVSCQEGEQDPPPLYASDTENVGDAFRETLQNAEGNRPISD